MSRKFWAEFLDLYISMECLWKVKSADYSDRDKKALCFHELIEKCREVETEPTLDFVKRKINSFRTTFRKEAQKVKDSLRSGATYEEVYKPSLWYYDVLSPILADHPAGRLSRPPLDDSSDEPHPVEFLQNEYRPSSPTLSEDFEGQNSSTSGIVPLPTTPCNDTKGPNKRGKIRSKTSEDLLLQVCKRLRNVDKTQEDEYDAIGRNVAAKLRGMTTNQRIIGERLISDVLYLGQLESLTHDSCVNSPSRNSGFN